MHGEFQEGPSQADKEFKAPKIEIQSTNPINMLDTKQNTPNQEKLESNRENFDKKMSEVAEKLRVPKADLIADYGDEEHALRDENPEDTSMVYGSKAVEKLIIEKIKAGYDSLTGINNRVSLDKEVERRNKEVKKNGEFSMIMIDIDKFKNVNDTYGHLAGDYVLKEVAAALQDTMRQGDFLSRIGGEEMVVLTNADADAIGFAERLRKIIESKQFTFKDKNDKDQDIKVTISAGVSPYDKNFEKMKTVSDTGLYLAKGDAKKLTEGIKVEPGHEGAPTRNQVWYLDKETGEFRKNK